MKTIEYKGKVYEIGKYYLFGDSEWWVTECLKLESIVDDAGDYVFKTRDDCWKLIRETPSSYSFGTITDAPVELEDGAAYTFDFNGVKGSVGVCSYEIRHNSEHVMLLTAKNGDYNSEYCTNIRKMGVIEQ